MSSTIQNVNAKTQDDYKEKHSDSEAFSDENHDQSQSENGDIGDAGGLELGSGGSGDESVSEYDYRQKDSNEEALEKLVFGDSAGFRSALRDFDEPVATDEEQAGQATQGGLSAIPDGDLFFIDSAPSAAPAPKPADADEAEDSEGPGAAPAWIDSDDERLQISLMAAPRLRKLRKFEGEDVISGTEYQRRLRKQYQALHPPPKWASWLSANGSNERPKKRRKIRAIGEQQESGDKEASSASDSDVSMSSDVAPAPTLTSLLKSSQPLARRKPTALNPYSNIPRLPPEVLNIERLPDIVSSSSPQPHATTSLSLHPTLPLLISSGISGMVYMHHLKPFPTPPDPPNPLVTSLHMKNTPMTTAVFSPLTGTQADPKIYMACARRLFHTWTLPTGAITKTTHIGGESTSSQRVAVLKPSPCGRWLGVLGQGKKGGGTVNILSASTMQWVAQARGEGRGGLADFCWWSDGEGLSLVGKLGEVAEWSVDERQVVLRWVDQGGVGITVMALGRDPEGSTSSKKKNKRRQIGPDRWAVLGTNSGFVTIYDRHAIAKARQDANDTANGKETIQPLLTPTPHATLSHLVTAITQLAISSCGQLLAMASKWKRDALRLVHLQSATVYRNWPTSKTPLGRISSLVLGECEGVVQAGDDEGRGLVLVAGNERGLVNMWGIRG